MISKKLRRPCKVCGEYFVPEGKYQKHCDKCYQDKRILLGQKILASWERKKQKQNGK